MSHIANLTTVDLRAAVGNRNFVKGILARATTAATAVKSTSAYTYSVDGVLAPIKSALSEQSVAVTHTSEGLTLAAAGVTAYVQAAGTSAYYVIALDVAGTVGVFQGAAFTTGTAGAFPKVAYTYTPIGFFKVVVASSTFTAGTTALDAGTLTTTYVDVSSLPSVAP